MERFNSTVNNGMSFMSGNQYISAFLAILIIGYAGLAAPKLPEKVARIFDYTIVKIFILFVIAYMANKNPMISILMAVAIVVSLQTLSKYHHARMIGAHHHHHMQQQQRQMATTKEEFTMQEQEAGSVEMPQEVVGELGRECAKDVDYRNSFYPQYVNMKPDAYDARFTGSDVNGFDTTAAYSSI